MVISDAYYETKWVGIIYLIVFRPSHYDAYFDVVVSDFEWLFVVLDLDLVIGFISLEVIGVN